MYQRNASQPPMTPRMPAPDKTRAIMAFSSLSAMRPATMPPTTPVMVSMNMKRAVIWAKVFSPKKALSTPPVWCQSAWPGQSMKERMPTITRSVATDASPKMIEMRVWVRGSTRPAR